MRHILHLLAIDCSRGAALVSWFGSRWLLPILSCDQRMRAGPVVKRWAAARGISGETVGQWLGRMNESSIDWLVVMVVDRFENAQFPLAWAPCGTLAPKCALVDYQAWALAQSSAGGSRVHVPGPFGTLEWFDDLLAWALTAIDCDRCRSVTGYRLSSYEVVLGLDTSRGTFYVKGLTGERRREPSITAAMATLAPDSFATTVACERRGDTVCWVTLACDGSPIPMVQIDRAATGLARLQQQTSSAPAALRELPSLDLRGKVEWAEGLGLHHEIVATLRRSVEDVLAAGLPHTWLPLDLDPGNVLVDASGAVRFIDLDDSFIGPAPLAMAVLAGRCSPRDSLQAYADAWSPALGDIGWTAFEDASALVEAWLGWHRVERNTERGEITGALERARSSIAKRLTRVVQRR